MLLLPHGEARPAASQRREQDLRSRTGEKHLLALGLSACHMGTLGELDGSSGPIRRPDKDSMEEISLPEEGTKAIYKWFPWCGGVEDETDGSQDQC